MNHFNLKMVMHVPSLPNDMKSTKPKWLERIGEDLHSAVVKNGWKWLKMVENEGELYIYKFIIYFEYDCEV